MKPILLSIIFLFSFLFQVKAQSEEKREKIKELLALQHIDSLTYEVFYNFAKPVDFTAFFKDSAISKIFPITKKDSTTNGKIKKMLSDSVYMSSYIKMMQTKEIKYDLAKVKNEAAKFINEDLVGVYDKSFSLEEITDYITFSKTKSGQKYFNTLPVIEKEILALRSDVLFKLVSSAKL